MFIRALRKNELRRRYKLLRAATDETLSAVRAAFARFVGIPRVRIETVLWARKRFGAGSTEARQVMATMNFAIRAHGKQMRKFDGKPYVSHLLSVARRVADRTTDVDLVQAAILHDTLEDTPIQKNELTARFGKRVATLVEGLTDVYTPAAYPDLNRKARKALEAQRVAAAGPEVHLIKACDLMDNAESIKKHDPKFWEKAFQGEMRNMLEEITQAPAKDLEALRAIIN
jgi:guanosine-3',5'-bis(diphosphate) 3'-pyrophosphohydrolase